MEIHGPLTIGIADAASGLGRELHIDFKPGFRERDLAGQGEQFRAYLGALSEYIVGTEEDDPNRAGMLLVQQIAEGLLPHVEAGDIALSDTIVVEVGGAPGVSLTDLLS